MAETLFEQLAKPDEPIERLRATNELNQQIDVAIGPRGPVQHRTEEGEPCDTERTNLVFHGTESLLDTFSGERRRGHAHQCTEILAFGQVVAERPKLTCRVHQRPLSISSAPAWCNARVGRADRSKAISSALGRNSRG